MALAFLLGSLCPVLPKGRVHGIDSLVQLLDFSTAFLQQRLGVLPVCKFHLLLSWANCIPLLLSINTFFSCIIFSCPSGLREHAILVWEASSHALHVLPVERTYPVAPLGIDDLGAEQV